MRRVCGKIVREKCRGKSVLENSVGWEEEVRKMPVGPDFVWDFNALHMY